MKKFKNGTIHHCVYDVCMNRKLFCWQNVIKKRKCGMHVCIMHGEKAV